jgi:hypothetical protein
MDGIAIVAEGAVLKENGENTSLGLRSAISEVAGCRLSATLLNPSHGAILFVIWTRLPLTKPVQAFTAQSPILFPVTGGCGSDFWRTC